MARKQVRQLVRRAHFAMDIVLTRIRSSSQLARRHEALKAKNLHTLIQAVKLNEYD
jgi:hypothetical protein